MDSEQVLHCEVCGEEVDKLIPTKRDGEICEACYSDIYGEERYN